MAFNRIAASGQAAQETHHGDVLAQDLHLLPLFAGKSNDCSRLGESLLSYYTSVFYYSRNNLVSLYIYIFCFQLGIDDLLLGIEAGIAGEHIGNEADDGKIDDVFRAEELH